MSVGIDLYGVGLFGVGFTAAAFLIGLLAYQHLRARFVRVTGPYFLLPGLAFVALVVGVSETDAFTLFVLAEFVYLILLLQGYARGFLGLERTSGGAEGAGMVAVVGITPYAEAALTIGSIYLAFTVAASLLQRIFVDRRGSYAILASFLFLSASVVAQAFYELQGYRVFFQATVLALLGSVILFELPLALALPWAPSPVHGSADGERPPRGTEEQ